MVLRCTGILYFEDLWMVYRYLFTILFHWKNRSTGPVHNAKKSMNCIYTVLSRGVRSLLAPPPPPPWKQIERYESDKPIKSKLTYRQSINQSKGPTTKDPPLEKLPHGDDFRVGRKNDRTPRDNIVSVSKKYCWLSVTSSAKDGKKK